MGGMGKNIPAPPANWSSNQSTAKNPEKYQ